MSRRKALAVRHLPANPPEAFESGTRFGRFMELLTRRRFPQRAALDGSPVGCWQGFPVEEAVTNGMLLVILDFAKKEDRPVATSDDVVAVAKRVDTLVNAGLSVGFANAEAAADAFVRRVVEPVHRAARMGYRPDDPPTMAAWKEIAAGKGALPAAPRPPRVREGAGEIGPFLGRPAALFFVRVINGALRHRARIEARLAEIERHNRVLGPVTWIPDSELDFARGAVRLLGGRGERGGFAASPASPARHMPARWGGWLEAGASLEACRKRIATIRQWPVRLDAGASGMLPSSVQEGWADTIALKAIGRRKSEGDTLPPAVFWKAISMYGETCGGEKGTRPLRDRILKSLVSRGGGMSADALASLRDAIDGSIARIGGAFEAYGELVSGMESAGAEMSALSSSIRKIDARLARLKKGTGDLLEARDSAADRLARLQDLHDRAKSEFRSNHFPAVFMHGTDPEEAFAGGAYP